DAAPPGCCYHVARSLVDGGTRDSCDGGGSRSVLADVRQRPGDRGRSRLRVVLLERVRETCVEGHGLCGPLRAGEHHPDDVVPEGGDLLLELRFVLLLEVRLVAVALVETVPGTRVPGRGALDGE